MHQSLVVVVLALAAELLLAVAPARSEVVDPLEYFQLVPGKVWTLRNAEYPERVTTISVKRTRGGALVMRFAKSHPDTYHGADGTNNDLIWFITVGPQWIHAGNSNGDDAVDDA